MRTTRKKLKELLTERLVPLLWRSGFIGPSKIAGNKLIHKYRRQVPEGAHVLAIQFEKRGQPRFIILLHVEPPDGLDPIIARGGEIMAASLKPRSGPYTRSWFRADPPWWKRLIRPQTPTLENEAIDECIRLLPEVEAWFKVQLASKHITCWPVRYRGSQSS